MSNSNHAGQRWSEDQDDAAAKLKIALATLGLATWKANNCELKTLNEDGQEVTRIFRDSVGKPPWKSPKNKDKEKAAQKKKDEEAAASKKKAAAEAAEAERQGRRRRRRR